MDKDMLGWTISKAGGPVFINKAWRDAASQLVAAGLADMATDTLNDGNEMSYLVLTDAGRRAYAKAPLRNYALVEPAA